MSDQEYTITQKEAADYLDVSTKTISRYRKKGLPYKMMLNPVTPVISLTTSVSLTFINCKAFCICWI